MCQYEIWDFPKIEKVVLGADGESELWDFFICNFTPRQIAICLELEKGKTQAEIARDWGVSDEAIRQQLELIREKLTPHLKSKRILKNE